MKTFPSDGEMRQTEHTLEDDYAELVQIVVELALHVRELSWGRNPEHDTSLALWHRAVELRDRMPRL